MISQRKLICVLAHPDNESLGNSQKGAAMMQFKEPEIAMVDGQRLAFEEFNHDILAFFERPDGHEPALFPFLCQSRGGLP